MAKNKDAFCSSWWSYQQNARFETRHWPAGKILHETACDDCSQGKYRGGADEDVQCLDCPTGYKNELVSSGSCLPCIPGEYQNEKGKSICKLCDVNEKSEKKPLV